MDDLTRDRLAKDLSRVMKTLNDHERRCHGGGKCGGRFYAAAALMRVMDLEMSEMMDAVCEAAEMRADMLPSMALGPLPLNDCVKQVMTYALDLSDDPPADIERAAEEEAMKVIRRVQGNRPDGGTIQRGDAKFILRGVLKRCLELVGE